MAQLVCPVPVSILTHSNKLTAIAFAMQNLTDALASQALLNIQHKGFAHIIPVLYELQSPTYRVDTEVFNIQFHVAGRNTACSVTDKGGIFRGTGNKDWKVM